MLEVLILAFVLLLKIGTRMIYEALYENIKKEITKSFK